jgi:hypothetical protein
MFDVAETADRPADISLAEMDRRVALTRGSGRLTIQDQLDWSEVLLASGDRASARLLIESAAIRQGFSSELERARADLFAAVGIERTPSAPDAAGTAQGNTVDAAIAELRRFARAYGERIGNGIAEGRRQVDGKPGLHPTATLARGASAPDGRGVAALVGQAFSWLRSPSAQDDEAGTAAIDALRGSERDPSRWAAAGLAGGVPPVLARAVALQETRAFLRAHTDLLLPVLGSAAVFRATASFGSMGLGPYFGNVGQIAQSSANLFELAGIAAEAAGASGDPIVEQAWVALLSRGLTNWLRYDIVDELGDRDASFALTLILRRTVAVASDDVDRGLVARIRDAALDNLDYDLAGAAQQQLVTLSHNAHLERRILGTIQASAGRVAAAEQLLSACLDEHPGDEWLRQEVLANRERRFAPFALVKGYGSPRDRQLKRLAGRGVAA